MQSLLGHEQVWHGFIDIVFSSHLGIPAMANTVLDIEENISKKRRVDEQDGKDHKIYSMHLP